MSRYIVFSFSLLSLGMFCLINVSFEMYCMATASFAAIIAIDKANIANRRLFLQFKCMG